MSIEWAHPLALLLLLLIPLYPLLSRGRQALLPFPRASELRVAGAASPIIGLIPGALRCLTLVLLVLAMAGPTSARVVGETHSEGVPIVLALDISASMLAQDFRPRDRLTVAKATIADFAENRPGDPIGLVAFAAEALTLVPVTMNRPVLQSAIESLQVGLLEDGTAIGDGLAGAVNRLRTLDSGGVIVLLSDGQSNRGTVEPVNAARAAAALGVKVFTVGVGSESVAAVPISAGPAGFRYAELPVGLDEELLGAIATITGGEYFRATDTEALQEVYREIDRLVPSTVETERTVERTGWAAPLLILAAGMLVLEWALRGSRWGALP